MPNPVTGVTATVDSTNSLVTVAWTQSTSGSLTGNRIEGQPVGTTQWTKLYNGPVTTSYVVYPALLVPWSIRVFAVDVTGLSTPTLAPSSVTIPGRGPRNYPVILTSTSVPSLQVALGASDSLDQISWTNVTGRVMLQPMGQTDPRLFFPSSATRVADQMKFGLIANDPNGSGGTIFATDIIATLNTFEQSHHLLIYRDTSVANRYCYLWDLKSYPWMGLHYTVEFKLQQAPPPYVQTS